MYTHCFSPAYILFLKYPYLNASLPAIFPTSAWLHRSSSGHGDVTHPRSTGAPPRTAHARQLEAADHGAVAPRRARRTPRGRPREDGSGGAGFTTSAQRRFPRKVGDGGRS